MNSPAPSAENPFSGLRVLEPGPYSLVVDFGRPQYRSLGVPVGGAADRAALALGNSLVGNPVDCPALEISLAGPTLQATCELACVVYGAPFSLASDRRPPQALQTGKTFTLSPDEELRIGGTERGMRAYLCVRGGLSGKIVLGSQSAFAPVAAGVEMPCRAHRLHARYFPPLFPLDSGEVSLRVLPGLQADWFAEGDIASREFTVAKESNRMGVRLHGPAFRVPARQLTSEPVCPGSVQVTSDGQCIILGVDGQTIGGYPKIAQVVGADLDRVGQLRPGDRIRLQLVALEEAYELHRKRRALLNEWVVRLQNSLLA